MQLNATCNPNLQVPLIFSGSLPYRLAIGEHLTDRDLGTVTVSETGVVTSEHLGRLGLPTPEGFLEQLLLDQLMDGAPILAASLYGNGLDSQLGLVVKCRA